MYLRVLAKFTFPIIVLILHWELVYINFYRKKVVSQFRKRYKKKMIGDQNRLREKDDLPLWRAPAIKKKPPFFYVRALITREIMRSKDAQCNLRGYVTQF